MTDGKRKSPQKEANRLSNLLRQVLGEDRFPVDVEALAREVSRNNEDPIGKIGGGELPGVEGMLRPHRRRPEWHIVYNDDPRYRGRGRFTIAHEFGHYQLHRPLLSSKDYATGSLMRDCDFQCKPLRPGAWQEAERQREEEADTFASYLLMPLDDYRAQLNGDEMSVGLLNHVTHRYGVSLIAACRKWIDFTENRAAMIVARDGFAKWGRASKSALKSGIFVRSGMPIPDNALVTNGDWGSGFVSETPVQRPDGIWNFSGGSEPVRELAMVSEFLDMSLTILQFDDAIDGREFDTEPVADCVDQFMSGSRR
ncbi:ImmA/IrrE family metallo-endopeptidase [Alexandriicola marinus]|uniref:ImmA/IrrE family metallo-endopeptidase n=1 Tax=Alexandriicola marinus TaxID=2081710 RepID=UPI000FDBB8E1|nr:ImmA/IrrE family metallo-endopeptidase [Alexandriicola marinus]